MSLKPFKASFLIRKLAMAIILFAVTASGQDRSSTIMGTVKDSSGACVAEASVIVLNQDTNASVGMKTNGNGDYEVPSLQPGTYTVVIKKDGFQPFRKDDIGVGSTQTVRVNAVLTSGKSAQTGQ